MNTNDHNDYVMRECLRRITPINAGVIVTCCSRGLGERRASGAIIATAEEFGADVPVVLAAFGFIMDDPDIGYEIPIDVLLNNFGVLRLPDDEQVRAAFGLSLLTYGGPASSNVMRDRRTRPRDANRIQKILDRNQWLHD